MQEKNRYLMISVDTEGDDQWDTSHAITTKNAAAVPRFQELCEKYGMKPVWLTDYEMAKDPTYVAYIRPKMEQGLCEIGMHLHAWTTPPEYPLQRTSDAREFLIEYTTEEMSEKIKCITELLTETFGVRPISHRSGRWVMDERYFDLLAKYEYKVDCSVTPLVSWESTVGASGVMGCDYSGECLYPNMHNGKILEIPVTIRRLHFLNMEKVSGPYSLAREIRNALTGIDGWLRPYDIKYSSTMMRAFRKASEENADLLMTLHSSELMAGTNQVFRTEEDIDYLFGMMEKLLKAAKEAGYTGCTMKEYYEQFVRSSRSE